VKGLWKRWLALVLFVAVLAFTFVQLGEWQLRRLHGRLASNSLITGNSAKPVQSWSNVFSHTIVDHDAWQRVSAAGRFDANLQLVVRGRNDANDRAGVEIVTALHTDGGKLLLVDRGFIPTDSGEIDAAPPPPTGTVQVVGFVRRNERGQTGAIGPADGSVRLINSDAIATAWGTPLVNGYLAAITISPSQSGGLQAATLPVLSDGPHLSYAIQWFCFTIIAVIGAGIFIRDDVRARRRQREKRAAEVAESEVDTALASTGPDADTARPATDAAASPTEPLVVISPRET